MNTKESQALQALTEKVSAPDYELPNDAVAYAGTDASRAQALAMLLDAAGTPTERELVRNVGGRPTLDPHGSQSVSWRGRVPQSLDEKFRAVATSEGRTFSEALRTAAEEYIDTHAKAG